ncbi:MAG: glycosyl hydrolase [Acidobacteriota bacterium]|nr:glycosyl hydrolase [Blastocatellia bacterium]MDW8240238.1 glycosyl hydrolase [Acidobacteriota bacterium]
MSLRTPQRMQTGERACARAYVAFKSTHDACAPSLFSGRDETKTGGNWHRPGSLRAWTRRWVAISLIVSVVGWVLPTYAQPEAKSASLDVRLYKALQWRSIGPYRGGRSVAVAGHPRQPYTFYFGATGGGVWKTEDGGITWINISDGTFKTGSVGAIAVAESDPNVIYVGMGEACIRGNVSPGDGVYKSEDAGKTWKHVGLADTQTISRVRVHPNNPDLVYVAAFGHAFGPHAERGVYRSKNGGATWEKVLFKDNKTGAIDLILDPSNPRIIYAALWEAYRNPWSLSSGGPGSGLYKSTDGGDTWTELTNNEGLPKGIKGRIGITVSPAQPERLWAIIEAEDGGVFRSDNGGQTWRKMNDDRRLLQRAWYYSHIYADPKDAETVYVLNVQFLKSVDGGKTFDRTISVPHGDNHDLWIDPNNPLRMINANDGGANVTYNGGATWTEQDQPTAQFYHVTVDNQFPYRVYGAQQDNTTVSIASRTTSFGIDRTDWHPVGGCESGYIAVRPDDPNIVYAGCYGGYLSRYDHRTRQVHEISVWPESPIGWGAGDLKYRFQWTAPILISPHDPTVLYTAGNHVFKSTDEGMSWQIISPDLTRNDKSKQGPSGGPITKDNTSVEYYNTIFALAESPRQAGLLWAGTDDGRIHISRNGGRSWEEVTPKELPEWTLISIIEPSPHDAATAYVAATRYKFDDFKPYIYKTNDYGKSWKKITAGIPDVEYTRVVREDPHRRGLLYAGTERGVHVSFDDGQQWQSLQLNLPATPIHDLVIQPREKDLIVATHGRSFWILDDLAVLHQLSREVANADAYLFAPETTYRMGGSSFSRPGLSLGTNPPNGAVLYYYLKEKPKTDIKLEILDEAGAVIRTFSSAASAEPPPTEQQEESFGARRAPTKLPAEAGLNRFIWDLRYPDATALPGALLWGGSTRGPVAVPGRYQVRLTVGDIKLTQPLQIVKDPRLTTTPEDFKQQFELLIKLRDKLSQAHEAVLTIREARKQVDDLARRLKDHPNAKSLGDTAKSLQQKFTAIEEELVQVRVKSSQDVLNYPIKLNNKLAALASTVASADARPTRQMYDVFNDLSARLDAQLTALQQVISKDLAAFNRTLRDGDIPAVLVKPASQRNVAPPEQ